MKITVAWQKPGRKISVQSYQSRYPEVYRWFFVEQINDHSDVIAKNIFSMMYAVCRMPRKCGLLTQNFHFVSSIPLIDDFKYIAIQIRHYKINLGRSFEG